MWGPGGTPHSPGFPLPNSPFTPSEVLRLLLLVVLRTCFPLKRDLGVLGNHHPEADPHHHGSMRPRWRPWLQDPCTKGTQSLHAILMSPFQSYPPMDGHQSQPGKLQTRIPSSDISPMENWDGCHWGPIAYSPPGFPRECVILSLIKWETSPPSRQTFSLYCQMPTVPDKKWQHAGKFPSEVSPVGT